VCSSDLDACAARVGVSRKHVRGIYIELRDRLADVRFAKWHRANIILPEVPDPVALVTIKSAFFDAFAQCHANERCFKNFSSGNRKTRICRNCPIPSRLTNARKAATAVASIDGVRAFYRSLKIFGESRADPLSLFRRRLIHTTVMAAAMENTRTLRSGLPDPKDNGFLSVQTLFLTLLGDLIERPLRAS